jgi:hypothetical protein
MVQSMATWYRPEGGPIKTEIDPLWTNAPEPIGSAVRTVAEMETAVLESATTAVVLRYGGLYGPRTWYAREGRSRSGWRGACGHDDVADDDAWCIE